MSEPKVLHEWSEDGTDWRILEGDLGSEFPSVQVRRLDGWWTLSGWNVIGPYARFMAREILRLLEQLNAAPAGEEMTAQELRNMIASTGSFLSEADGNVLCKVLLRRKEQP